MANYVACSICCYCFVFACSIRIQVKGYLDNDNIIYCLFKVSKIKKEVLLRLLPDTLSILYKLIKGKYPNYTTDRYERTMVI